MSALTNTLSNYIEGFNVYIKPTSILVTDSWLYEGFNSKNRFNISTVLGKTKGGQLSEVSKRKMKNAINWLVLNKKLGKGIVNFITLTYSSKERKVSDYYIKRKLLKPFLRRLRYKFPGIQYVWRIEKHKNGNTHIHLTTNKWIDWKLIRNNWNQLLYRKGLLTHYMKQNGCTDANSTDVHSVYKVNNLAAYLSKYMSKNNDDNTNEGRLWGCSTFLQKIQNVNQFISLEMGEHLYKHLKKLKNIFIEHDEFQIGRLFLYNDIKELPVQFRRVIEKVIWKMNNLLSMSTDFSPGTI